MTIAKPVEGLQRFNKVALSTGKLVDSKKPSCTLSLWVFIQWLICKSVRVVWGWSWVRIPELFVVIFDYSLSHKPCSCTSSCALSVPCSSDLFIRVLYCDIVIFLFSNFLFFFLLQCLSRACRGNNPVECM